MGEIITLTASLFGNITMIGTYSNLLNSFSIKQFLGVYVFTLICASAALAESNEQSDDKCQTLDGCIEKYQSLLPEWRDKAIDLGKQLEEDIPKLKDNIESLGKEGKEKFESWMDHLHEQLPESILPKEEEKPEATWI